MTHIQPLSTILSSTMPGITSTPSNPLSYASPMLLTPHATPFNFIHSQSQNFGRFMSPYQIPALSTPIVTSCYEQLQSQRRRALPSQQTSDVGNQTSTHTLPVSPMPWGLAQQHSGTNRLPPVNPVRSSTVTDENT